MKNIISSILFFILLLGQAYATDWTVVSLDIVEDTVWTKEMSPIIIRWQDEKVTKINIINWSTLKIEPWVKVIFWPNMNLIVTNQCKRWYINTECFKDANWKVKYPSIISKWTYLEPILFTSKNDFQWKDSKPWDWWNIIINSDWTQIEFTQFKYWWWNEFEYFLDLRKWWDFKNNVIDNIKWNAIYVRWWLFENNVIKNVSWNWVVCDYDCKIKNNVIRDNTWDAIRLNPTLNVIVQNNFISSNLWYWVILDYYFVNSFDILNNFFRSNKWWIKVYHNNSKFSFKNNNFVKNEDFSIFSQTNDIKNKVLIDNNYFNIDNWPSYSWTWEFFISEWFDSTNYSKEEINFSFQINTPSFDDYNSFVKSKSEDTDFFSLLSKRKAIIWDLNLAWSLVQYSISLNNLKRKSIENIKLEILLPKDQDVLVCSFEAKNEEINYVFSENCKSKSFIPVDLKNWKITWSPGIFSALKSNNLYFVTSILSSKNNNTEIEKPKINFINNWNSQSLNYEFDSNLKISEVLLASNNDKGLESKNKNSTEPKKDSTVKSKTTLKKTSKIEEVKKEVSKTPVTNVKKVQEEIKNTTNVVTTNNDYLEMWVIIKRVKNWQLNLYLVNDAKQEFKLFWRDQWNSLLEFIKSDKKNNKIKAYWDYYKNSLWKKSWIILKSFSIIY